MARVDALFVSWARTSLIASIVLTAAACGVSQGGAPTEDVAGPTLATPSAAPTRTAQAYYAPAPRPPDGQRASAFEAVPPTPTGATEQADAPPRLPPRPPTGQPSRQTPARLPPRPPTGATEQVNDPPPAATPPTGDAGKRPPSATARHGRNRAGKRPPAPPPPPTGATEQANDPPPAATPATPPPTAGDDLTARPRPASSGLRQLPDEESESPSDWESLDDVSRSAQGAEYTWQDGRHTRRAHVQIDLVAQAEEETRSDDIVVRGGGEEHVVRRQPRHDEAALPVFRSESGEILTLPGGVLLALDASWDQARVDQFFLENGITGDRIARQQFAVHAFLVETEPGFPSLELANTLAAQDGVLLSSPNWRREESPR